MRFENMCLALAYGPLTLTLAGCPMDDDEPASRVPDAGTNVEASADVAMPPAAPTHSGLVSIQDVAIANLPAAGHGLTVTTFFNPLVAPDFVDSTDGITGCRAWAYDVASKPPPPETDQGELEIDGVKNGALSCRFVPQRGYVCPTSTGSGSATIAASSGATTKVTIAGAAFAETDVGRYLSLTGASGATNNGAAAIVAVPSPTEVVITNARATTETFTSTWTVLAGAGPTPNDLYTPFVEGQKIGVELVPNASAVLEVKRAEITPGDAFVLDAASQARITSIPVTGESITLRCETCGKAEATLVRISSTDADVTNASPVAMPPPVKKQVEIQCVVLGADVSSVTVPAGAMRLLQDAHAASPLTRIRTAFMRDGISTATASPPRAPNPTYVISGHGLLGFTKP